MRAGIIGLGVGEKHIESYQGHPQCEVVALCDFSEEKISMVKNRYPGLKLTKKAEEILDDPEIDIVSIASFDNYHYEQIIQGLNNDKHLFVEKPLVLHPEEAKSIRKILNKKPSIRLSSNLNLRTTPRFIRLKEAVQSGELGRVYYLEGDYLWGRISKLTDGWRKEMDFYSIVHGAAVHMIDLILWIMEMKPLEVKGYGNRIATQNSGFKFNDFAVILMRFENGMIAKVSANGGCVHPHFHRMGVFGTKKTFSYDISGGKMIDSSDPNADIVALIEEYPATNERKKVITTFIDSILNTGTKPVVSCEEVFETLSVCFAAEKSIHENRSILVEYI